jgi:hypothetical protein
MFSKSALQSKNGVPASPRIRSLSMRGPNGIRVDNLATASANDSGTGKILSDAASPSRASLLRNSAKVIGIEPASPFQPVAGLSAKAIKPSHTSFTWIGCTIREGLTIGNTGVRDTNLIKKPNMP